MRYSYNTLYGDVHLCRFLSSDNLPNSSKPLILSEHQKCTRKPFDVE